MNKIICFIFFLWAASSFSQVKDRVLVLGIIKSDSLETENITIFNVSSNIGAISDVDGKFSIKLRENDTLVIQGLAFLSSKYIVQQNDLSAKVLEIFLKVRVNELNEVEVSPFTLTGDLNKDTKKIKTYAPNLSGIDYSKLKPTDVRETKVVNTAMPNTMAQTPVNILAVVGLIGKGIISLIGSKKQKISASEKAFNDKRLKEIQSKSFSQHMKEQFSNHFFINELQINNADIPLFLAFSEVSNEKLAQYLQQENKLDLIEHLISKSKEFKKQKNK